MKFYSILTCFFTLTLFSMDQDHRDEKTVNSEKQSSSKKPVALPPLQLPSRAEKNKAEQRSSDPARSKPENLSSLKIKSKRKRTQSVQSDDIRSTSSTFRLSPKKSSTSLSNSQSPRSEDSSSCEISPALQASTYTFLFKYDDFDNDTLWLIGENSDHTASLAQKYALESSDMLKIYRDMKQTEYLKDPLFLCYINRTILELLKHEDFIDGVLCAEYNIMPEENTKRQSCFPIIQKHINKTCNNAIIWPTIQRTENSEQYSRQLLQHNKTIKSRDRKIYAAGIATGILLYQFERGPIKLKYMELHKQPNVQHALEKHLKSATHTLALLEQ